MRTSNRYGTIYSQYAINFPRHIAQLGIGSVKRIVSDELDKKLSKALKKALEDELPAALAKKASKEEIGDITKKVLKKLYKDLSMHHPYIIDRIKI